MVKNPFSLQALKKRRRTWWRVLGERIGALVSAVWRWLVKAYNHLSGELKRRAFMARLHRADIILASPRALSLSPGPLIYRLVLRARYVHSMLYLGDGKIIHTTTRSGVVIGPLPRRIYKRDRYTILRVPNLRPELGWQIVREALKFKGRKLDEAGLLTNVPARLLGLRRPLLRLERNRTWCSKLIQQAYSASGIDLVPQTRVETITSEDLSRSPLLEKV
ncbi:MAG: hypothetical protein JSU87_02405 [Gemmatimonadota bacterium]|nr:MAG: hypothetical protein JSU87_02405 [Gemmatimonadota bacterium]